MERFHLGTTYCNDRGPSNNSDKQAFNGLVWTSWADRNKEASLTVRGRTAWCLWERLTAPDSVKALLEFVCPEDRAVVQEVIEGGGAVTKSAVGRTVSAAEAEAAGTLAGLAGTSAAC
jgi:hypothetical protein